VTAWVVVGGPALLPPLLALALAPSVPALLPPALVPAVSPFVSVMLPCETVPDWEAPSLAVARPESLPHAGSRRPPSAARICAREVIIPRLSQSHT
jgi:hypothetical protein